MLFLAIFEIKGGAAARLARFRPERCRDEMERKSGDEEEEENGMIL